ncbi:hypothetical protein RRG08_056611 [Elysia crispata]|uniref:Uncharacterized protein n=1 Tax=Elysia crispata TaxID=231223 RepID=A0AAE1DG87_9GAST|nr:hypothetical protein RRG08_056611 [Elysia crispata]
MAFAFVVAVSGFSPLSEEGQGPGSGLPLWRPPCRVTSARGGCHLVVGIWANMGWDLRQGSHYRYPFRNRKSEDGT